MTPQIRMSHVAHGKAISVYTRKANHLHGKKKAKKKRVDHSTALSLMLDGISMEFINLNSNNKNDSFAFCVLGCVVVC